MADDSIGGTYVIDTQRERLTNHNDVDDNNELTNNNARDLYHRRMKDANRLILLKKGFRIGFEQLWKEQMV